MECGRSKARAWRFNPVLELCKGKKKRESMQSCLLGGGAARYVAGTAKTVVRVVAAEP